MLRIFIPILTVVVITLAAGLPACALNFSVAGFYAPGLVIGEAAEVNEVAAGGYKGRVAMGIYDGLGLALSFGYNDFVYREDRITIPEYKLILSIPTFIATVGADYAFLPGSLRPYVGAGAVMARESAEAAGHTATDWYPGFYTDGGMRFFAGKSWSVEAGLRYTFLLDEPVIGYDGFNAYDFERSENRTQLLEFLVGAGYYF